MLCGLSTVSVPMSVSGGGKTSGEKLACGLDPLFLGVGIPVKRCLNICMSHDALEGLDVKERSGHCGKCMPENVCRRSVKIDGSGNAFPCAFVGLLCNRTVASDDIVALHRTGVQNSLQFRQQGDETISRFTLGRPDDRLIPCKGDAALNMNMTAIEINIRPTESLHLASPHPCVHGQKDEKSVCFV